MFIKKTANFRFIFYSFISLLLILFGARLSPELSQQFLESWQLWRDPILAGMACGLGISILGIYILLNRIVFVSLAISQGAGVGIFFTFWMGAFFAIPVDYFYFPLIGGLIFAMISATIFATLKQHKNFSEGSLLGLLYVLSSGFILLIGDRISEGKHDIENLLFGCAVAVTPQNLQLILIATIILVVMHLLFRREFLYISADPVFMNTRGLSPRVWNIILYCLYTLGITVGLRTLGGLPVFSLIVIPPFIALKRAHSLSEAFWVAVLIGTLLPGLGYYYSFIFSLPTGASLIFVGLFYIVASLIEGKIIRSSRHSKKKNILRTN